MNQDVAMNIKAPLSLAHSLAARLIAGDRRALARAVTLAESSRPADDAARRALMAAAAPHLGGALRLGLSGPPGVGKSSLIECLGRLLTGRGLRVAVLAVDPSSRRSGGSILGDKTRMPELSRDPLAFIRPTPSGGTLGGAARRTRESAALCEAAGYDVIIIETVGVGQSEIAAAGMTDVFALLIAPAGGDDLQGVKRGVMEAADLIAVTKADGDLQTAAARTRADYAAALRLMRPKPGDPSGWPQAMAMSSQEGEGVEAFWDAVTALDSARRASGVRDQRRRDQSAAWMRAELEARIHTLTASVLGDDLGRLEQAARAGEMSPDAAAEQALTRLTRRLAALDHTSEIV